MNKEKLNNIVEIFYQATFKTFYVNSIDEENFTKPLGIFVSLGMTTSPRILESVRSSIEDVSRGEFRASIAKISSKKVGIQFINTLLDTDSPAQFELVDLPEEVLTKDQACDELKKLKESMSIDQSLTQLKECAPKLSRLQELIDKLDETMGWEDHLIQRLGSDYRVFHKYVNYEKVNDIEYRLGIFVSNKSGIDEFN